MAISRRNRSAPTAAARSGCRTLIATGRSCRRSRARYTTAIPPWPISRCTSYRPVSAAQRRSSESDTWCVSMGAPSRGGPSLVRESSSEELGTCRSAAQERGRSGGLRRGLRHLVEPHHTPALLIPERQLERGDAAAQRQHGSGLEERRGVVAALQL